MLPMTTVSSTSLPTLPPNALPANALPANALPQRYVGRVFERLANQLGTKVADLYAGANPDGVQYEWATGLAGFSAAEIAHGLAACQHRKFAPNIGEFAQLCRPSLDAEIAWAEAGAGLAARERGDLGDWSHPAVYRAAMTMYAEVRAGSMRACRSRWELALRRESAAGYGDGIPDAPKRIANNPTLTRMSPEFLAKLQGMGFRIGRSA